MTHIRDWRFFAGRGRRLAFAVFCAPALFAGNVPALAQDGPSFDCAEAQSAAEKLVCGDAELAALDRLLADRFAAALAAVRTLDAGATEAEDELHAYQRGWVKGRDECWKAEDQRACVEGSYLRRDGELVARFLLESPTATTAWQCGDSPANEVVTMFFDTQLPSVRFERGDSVDTGSLVPSGSGAKYEGSFGRSIWIKGERATYRDPDPDGAEYECRATN
ncbi:MliC family protein [Nitratireductor alexandrii]|uniref:MliC family protein n=1 Tax=Nitratireductor alexandrii TaxID=2448161 RepID=UPI000FD886F1|nr:MliC family protein [Nitratireductor alexandrii]